MDNDVQRWRMTKTAAAGATMIPTREEKMIPTAANTDHDDGSDDGGAMRRDRQEKGQIREHSVWL
jgi:hypothetical protein